MSDGTRTRDRLDHNQVLYQLSYTHHALVQCTGQVSGLEISESGTTAPVSEPW